MNKEEFLILAKKMHGNKYIYSLVNLTTTKQHVDIICPLHGKFSQNVANHLYTGTGCAKCYVDSKRVTLENFKERANKTHNFRYDYSLIKKMPIKTTNVSIVCKIHGKFSQSFSGHLAGRGCSQCGYLDAKLKTSFTSSIFIEQAIKVHGNKYDYSLVVYINNNTKIKIICNIHKHIFEQTPSSHLDGAGCSICSKNKKLNTESFIARCVITHGTKYNYSLVNYINAHTKVTIICPSHGKFNQLANAHIRGSGCPKCRESKAEKIIEKFLIKNDIEFIPQYKITDCKNIRPLPFDFYFPSINLLLEYQGEQHYNPLRFLSKKDGKMKLKEVRRNDKIKRKYCKRNNIELLEITWKDNIKDKLEILITRFISTSQ